MRLPAVQVQLAAKADMSYQQVSAIERGARGASVTTLHRLARALGCDVDALMRIEEP